MNSSRSLKDLQWRHITRCRVYSLLTGTVKHRMLLHYRWQSTSTATRIRPTAYSYKRIVSTFRPERLTADDYIDVSNLTRLAIHIPDDAVLASQTSDKSDGAENSSVSWLGYDSEGGRHHPFPEGTHGFLYYFSPTFAHPLAGQLRFRVTISSDPSGFSAGHDLRDTTTTLPISWPLRRLAASKFLRPFTSLLVYEGLVTKELLEESTRLVISRNVNSTTSLYAFGQPFYIDFQLGEARFDILATVDGRNSIERAEIKYPAQIARRLYSTYPYYGSALCCFVRLRHDTIAIKILKMIRDVEVKGFLAAGRAFPEPVEGELLQGSDGPWLQKIPQDEQPYDPARRTVGNRRRALRLLKDCPDVSYEMF